MEETVFKKLNLINVDKHLEKKGNQTYLSWAHAWAVVKEHYPDVKRVIYEDINQHNYFNDGRTCWVKVGVVINGNEIVEMLPVMDMRNNSIYFDKVTSFDVNKAIQRATTKAIAMHGLGLYVYAGEDIPDFTNKPEEPRQKAVVNTKGGSKIHLNIGDENWSKVLKYVSDNKDLGVDELVRALEKKYIVEGVVRSEIETLTQMK